MNCPHCAAPVSEGALVCPQCHAALSMPPAAPIPTTPQFAAAAPALAPVPVYVGPPLSCSKATTSMVLGIVGLVLAVVLIGIPIGIVAVILGHLALSEIKRSGGRLQGRGKAIAGLVMGYACVAMILMLPFFAIIAAIAIPNLLKAKIAANEASAVASLRTYHTAIVSYETSCQRLPALLTELGPPPTGRGPTCEFGMDLVDATLAAGTKSGYNFNYIQDRSTHYELHADPISPGTTGMRHFFSAEDAVIHAQAGSPASADSPRLE